MLTSNVSFLRVPSTEKGDVTALTTFNQSQHSCQGQPWCYQQHFDRSRTLYPFNSYNNPNSYIVVSCEAVTMDDRRSEQSKRHAEYRKEYQNRPGVKERTNERMKEYMRLYRAKKKATRNSNVNCCYS